MKIREFETKNQLESELIIHVSGIISKAIEKFGNARILLSGGSTPINFYEKLSGEELDWSNVLIGLVDERFVPLDSQFCNETQIRNAFDKSDEATIVGMVLDFPDKQNNLIKVNQAYAPFFERIDFVLLGMGEDGHTASLFPGDKISEELLGSDQKGVFYTLAPNYPNERITCSKEMLFNSSEICLMICGESKLEVLQNSNKTKQPISYFTDHKMDLNVFYSKI